MALEGCNSTTVYKSARVVENSVHCRSIRMKSQAINNLEKVAQFRILPPIIVFMDGR